MNLKTNSFFENEIIDESGFIPIYFLSSDLIEFISLLDFTRTFYRDQIDAIEKVLLERKTHSAEEKKYLQTLLEKEELLEIHYQSILEATKNTSKEKTLH